MELKLQGIILTFKTGACAAVVGILKPSLCRSSFLLVGSTPPAPHSIRMLITAYKWLLVFILKIILKSRSLIYITDRNAQRQSVKVMDGVGILPAEHRAENDKNLSACGVDDLSCYPISLKTVWLDSTGDKVLPCTKKKLNVLLSTSVFFMVFSA